MNKKGLEVVLPWRKIITYLIVILVFVLIVVLLLMWRGMGTELINYLFGK